jgi:hypothetical protein
MELLETVNSLQYFKFVHLPEYQKLQFRFEDGQATGDPDMFMVRKLAQFVLWTHAYEDSLNFREGLEEFEVREKISIPAFRKHSVCLFKCNCLIQEISLKFPRGACESF